VEWGLPLIPIRLLKIGDAPADAVDLDAFGDGWRAALQPGSTVRGRVLDTNAGIRAATAAGVRAAGVRYRLPALLACLQPTATDAPAKPANGAAPVTPAADVSELALLRLLGLKQRVMQDAPHIRRRQFQPDDRHRQDDDERQADLGNHVHDG